MFINLVWFFMLMLVIFLCLLSMPNHMFKTIITMRFVACTVRSDSRLFLGPDYQGLQAALAAAGCLGSASLTYDSLS